MQALDTTAGRAMYMGTGRRKSSVARVRLVPGNGQLIVNGKPGDLYFQFNAGYLSVAKAPLETLGLENEYDLPSISANTRGILKRRISNTWRYRYEWRKYTDSNET